VDVEGRVVSQLDASLLIMDFEKLSRFCGFGDYLSGLVQNTKTRGDYFGPTPASDKALLSGWCQKLEPSFWKSAHAEHWFNVTFWDPFHAAARRDLEASSYEPWQYLHWYLRLWRNCVEHKKRESVAASFAHMRTLPRELLAAYDQLERVMTAIQQLQPRADARKPTPAELPGDCAPFASCMGAADNAGDIE
jgi:hypothetical protein